MKSNKGKRPEPREGHFIRVPDHPTRSENRDRFPCKGDEYPCVVCGKPCKNPKYYVRLHLGGDTIVTDEEGDRLNDLGLGGADLGGYPIGADCLRKHPELKRFVGGT